MGGEDLDPGGGDSSSALTSRVGDQLAADDRARGDEAKTTDAEYKERDDQLDQGVAGLAPHSHPSRCPGRWALRHSTQASAIKNSRLQISSNAGRGPGRVGAQKKNGASFDAPFRSGQIQPNLLIRRR
jgi:hypothetical protein